MRLSRHSSGGRAYCLDRDGIRGHVENPALARVPGAPEWMVAVYNHLGRAVAVIDVGAMLGLAPPNRSPRCLVLIACGAELLALCADGPPVEQPEIVFTRRGGVVELADRRADLLWINLALLGERIQEALLGARED